MLKVWTYEDWTETVKDWDKLKDPCVFLPGMKFFTKIVLSKRSENSRISAPLSKSRMWEVSRFE